MSKVGEYYRELEEFGLHESESKYKVEVLLCDGDCGNYYKEEHMNLAFDENDSHNLCKECMFSFLAEQEKNG